MPREKSEKPNPFYRGHEKSFDAGDKKIMSPVGSIFDQKTLSSNALDEGLSDHSRRRKGEK